MLLETLKNWNSDDHECITYDLFITYLTRDPRSRDYANKFNGNCIKKFAIISDNLEENDLEITEFQNFTRIKNEHLSETLSASITTLAATTNILIDISCMPRSSMADILAKLISAPHLSSVRIRTNYTIAKFIQPPSDILANESIEAVHSAFSGWSYADSKPTSLVLGLGYEPYKAEGASEFFEPYEQWVFIPTSPISEYSPKVLENNQQLISRVGLDKKTVTYKVDDPELTFGQLEQVVSSLTEKTNPVLMPFGPKIFFFLCLIQSMSHPEVGVWQVTGESAEGSNNTEASDCSYGVECLLLSTGTPLV